MRLICRWRETILGSRVRYRSGDDRADKVEGLVGGNPVEVRVLFGALKRPANAGLFYPVYPRRRARLAVFRPFSTIVGAHHATRARPSGTHRTTAGKPGASLEHIATAGRSIAVPAIRAHVGTPTDNPRTTPGKSGASGVLFGSPLALTLSPNLSRVLSGQGLISLRESGNEGARADDMVPLTPLASDDSTFRPCSSELAAPT
jgi:hypothetical protein